MAEARLPVSEKLKYELCNRSLASSLGFAGVALILLFFPLVNSPDWVPTFRIVAVLIILVSMVRWQQARKLLKLPYQRFQVKFKLHVVVIMINAVLQAVLFSLALTDPAGNLTSLIVSYILMMGTAAGSPSSLVYLPRLQTFYLVCQILVPSLAMFVFRSHQDPAISLIFPMVVVFVAFLIGNSRLIYKSFINRFEMEEELLLEKERLETAIRDLKKAQDEILNQKARAEYSSKMASVGQMAAGVAHEINSPLATILLTAEMLLLETENSADSDLSSGLTKIRSTSQRIAQIIQGLLIFSREDQKEPSQVFSLRSVIDNTLSLCRQRFEKGRIQLKVDNSVDSQIEGREAQISQVLLNLLNNAFDAVLDTAEPWVRIRVRDLGSDVEIAIENSGPPIPAEIQEEMFSPFFTTKPVGKGIGLGLSISRGIAESHEGELSLDSTSGTPRFLLKLPKAP